MITGENSPAARSKVPDCRPHIQSILDHGRKLSDLHAETLHGRDKTEALCRKRDELFGELLSAIGETVVFCRVIMRDNDRENDYLASTWSLILN